MKTKFLYLIIFGILFSFISCDNDKSNLPSGPAKKVLSPDLYSQLSSKYGQINDFEFGYAIVQKNKFGLIDYEGNEVLACIYDTIYSYNSDSKIISKNGKFGVIEYNGNIIFDLDFDDVKTSTDNTNLIALKKGSQWGLITTKGKKVVSFEYDKVANIEKGYIVVGQKGRYGILDSIGNIKINLDYDTIFFNYENSKISLAKKDNRIGIINSNLQLVTECKYNCEFLLSGTLPMIDKPQNGFIKLGIYQSSAKHPVLYGLINCETGEIAIPFEYDDLGSYSEELIWGKKDGKCGYLDINNNVIIKFEYDWAYDFSEGLAAVEKFSGQYVYTNMGIVPERKTGFIDKYGKIIIPFKFNSQVGNEPIFKEGLAPVGVSNSNIYGINKGYINKNGDFVIEPIYEEATPFEHGYGKVKKNGKVGVVNRKGEVIIPLDYDYLYFENDSIVQCSKGSGMTISEHYVIKNGTITKKD